MEVSTLIQVPTEATRHDLLMVVLVQRGALRATGFALLPVRGGQEALLHLAWILELFLRLVWILDVDPMVGNVLLRATCPKMAETLEILADHLGILGLETLTLVDLLAVSLLEGHREARLEHLEIETALLDPRHRIRTEVLQGLLEYLQER